MDTRTIYNNTHIALLVHINLTSGQVPGLIGLFLCYKCGCCSCGAKKKDEDDDGSDSDDGA